MTNGSSSVAGAIQTARAALARRDWSGAAAILAQAGPDLPVEGLLDQALALRMLGRFVDALDRIEAALALDPRHLVALLSKGALLERLNRNKAAALVYRNALACAPPDDVLPPALRSQLAHARQVQQNFSERLADHLRFSVADAKSRWAGESFERFDESLRIFAGLQRPYPQEPLLLHYPRLPAIPFYDRAQFPWLETLEAATPVIQEELNAVLAHKPQDFAPYIAFPPGVPVDQWAELNHSPRWTSFFLWRDGVRQDEACALCPRTAALMDRLPLMRQPGFAPTVIFSQLEPHTRIPPHSGSANHRLLCHLPLILPGPARFRVGAETRSWEMGKAWVFDDTIEHEAWNDADAPRTILIIDLWNPLISEAEKDLISLMMSASNAFRAEP